MEDAMPVPRLALLTGLLVSLLWGPGCARSAGVTPAPGTGAYPDNPGSGGGVAIEARDQPLEQVLARARATRRPVMLYFATTWCGYCRKLERETLSSPQAGRHMAGYLVAEYGADAGVGKELAARYGVTGFPTLVRVDAKGALVAVYEGYDGPADFVRRIPAP
jgi:thioredoxin-related protein